MGYNHENPGALAYERKYSNKKRHESTWRYRVCVGIVFGIFTAISVIIGIAGIIVSAGVIDKDS